MKMNIEYFKKMRQQLHEQDGEGFRWDLIAEFSLRKHRDLGCEVINMLPDDVTGLVTTLRYRGKILPAARRAREKLRGKHTDEKGMNFAEFGLSPGKFVIPDTRLKATEGSWVLVRSFEEAERIYDEGSALVKNAEIDPERDHFGELDIRECLKNSEDVLILNVPRQQKPYEIRYEFYPGYPNLIGRLHFPSFKTKVLAPLLNKGKYSFTDLDCGIYGGEQFGGFRTILSLKTDNCSGVLLFNGNGFTKERRSEALGLQGKLIELCRKYKLKHESTSPAEFAPHPYDPKKEREKKRADDGCPF